MTNEYVKAIEGLEKTIADLERQANELRSAVNILCKQAGISPRYPDGPPTGGGQVLTQIKPDTFYGKKQQTAVREYLEMRKGRGEGPAKPREIFDALKQGGFEFEANSDAVALVSLRALLRKRTETFHKVGETGAYGLTSWYENIKKKAAADNMVGGDRDDEADEPEIKAAASPKTAAA